MNKYVWLLAIAAIGCAAEVPGDEIEEHAGDLSLSCDPPLPTRAYLDFQNNERRIGLPNPTHCSAMSPDGSAQCGIINAQGKVVWIDVMIPRAQQATSLTVDVTRYNASNGVNFPFYGMKCSCLTAPWCNQFVQ